VFVKEMAKFVQPLIINETVIQDEANFNLNTLHKDNFDF
jgi:hypothetical protein